MKILQKPVFSPAFVIDLLHMEEKAHDMIRKNREEPMDRERQKALRAAIDAGEEALRHLDSAIVRLKDAETYGTWNLFSSHMSLHRRKYLRLNEAQAHIRQAEACLESCKALADMDVLPGYGQWMLNVEFDNLFTDQQVLEQIRRSRRNLTQIGKKIEKRQLRLMREPEKLADKKPE